ncbi:MAG: hypothetical protein ACRDDM_03765 [Paraclostridium sp.]
MRKVNVLIIDSGVDEIKFKPSSNIFLDIENNDIKESIISEAKNQHGNVISQIIKTLCQDANIHSICIFDENLVSDGRLLIAALKKALILKPDIINLSLGTNNFRYFLKLKRIIKKLVKLNCIIVIASNNLNEKSYLRYNRNVINVKGEFFFNNNNFRFDNKYFYAPFTSQALNIHPYIEGNSIATAFISGHIANIKKENYSYSYVDILNKLKN